MGFGRLGSGGGGCAVALDVDKLFYRRSVVLDFDRDYFYWNGAERVIGDLTTNAYGYIMTGVDWFPGTGYTVMTESRKDTGPEGGTILSLDIGSAGTRFEWFSQAEPNYCVVRVQGLGAASNINFVEPWLSRGRRRTVATFKNNSTVKTVINGEAITTSDPATQTVPNVACSRVGVGYSVSFNNGVFANEIHKIFVWPWVLSNSEIKAVQKYSTLNPVHLLGDSYLNQGLLLRELMLAYKETPWRRPTEDGVGSTSLTQQAVRFAATPQYFDATVIIVDGGLDTNSAESLAAIASIRSNIPHDRWLYIEPPMPASKPTGSEGNTKQLATLAAIKAAHPSHYVDTFDILEAANDGGADLEDVANGVCPRSLREDDVHLNDAGRAVYAPIISDALTAAGW